MKDIIKIKEEYEKRDFVQVYFNTREKVFLVVAEARRGLARGEIGQPTIVTDAEIDLRIGGLLVQHLDSFSTNVWSQEIARRCATPQEDRAFIKGHLSVEVERRPPGDLIMKPLHHERGGYTGKVSEQIVVPSKDVPGKVVSALRKAFSIAT